MHQLEIKEVPFDEILLNSHGLVNGRSVVGDVTGLKRSIEDNGLMDPLVVWNPEGEETLVLIAGYRRHTAISAIRDEVTGAFENINVSVFRGNLEEALAKNIEENVQRKNLNPADEAAAVYNLYDKVQDQKQVGQMLGMSQPWVSQRVNLYKGIVPRGLDFLRSGQINLKEARNIATLLNRDGTPDEDKQNEILDAFDTGEKVKIPKKERVKSYRTKQEFAELNAGLVEAKDEGSIDTVLATHLSAVMKWYRREIDLDSLLFDEHEDTSEVEDEDSVVTVTDNTSSVIRRRRISA